MLLLVSPDGQVTAIYGEEIDLRKLGAVTTRRASHVEPSPEGGWTADLSPVNGPVLGPFEKRSQALAAEVAWLEANLTTYKETL